MGSKLEYWFLLTKIAVMVLGGMIEERRRRHDSDLVAC
jgi:hypothetical protein